MAVEMEGAGFSHIHMYVDNLKPVEEYKKLEAKLNAFAKKSSNSNDIAASRAAWLTLSETHSNPVTGQKDPAQYSSAAQDIVEQLLVGVGWRITGSCTGPATRTLLVTSPDPNGIHYVVTTHTDHGMAEYNELDMQKREKDPLDHFDASHLSRYAKLRSGREGIAVLGFSVPKGGVEAVFAKYKELHPKLLTPDMPRTYSGCKVLEVYAYYVGEKGTSDADCGTLLRFVEYTEGSTDLVLPGLEKVDAAFDECAFAQYHDHWVSNVNDRRGFLDTLNETLGFTPKVQFNAGVVAAGEAQIESTVTGNNPGFELDDKDKALKDQSQIYLPTNNAISEAGHVYLFLKEIGQAVQHIAQRVIDLPALIQHANNMREITGAGLSFLQIPRSYYGSLLVKPLAQDAGIDEEKATRCIEVLKKAGIIDGCGIVVLDAELEKVVAALPDDVDKQAIANLVLRARYRNLYAVIKDQINESTYLKIVRNNILVDIQGEDLLMQIFTSNVLQRVAGQEAPFLEFIQRLCSDQIDANGKPKAIRPGCGGFGIRNFLTLFLSIEVSKAMRARAAAEVEGNEVDIAYNNKLVETFTAQLDESNPILTVISDCMTAEGEAEERGDAAELARLRAEKEIANQNLQECSLKYKNLMKTLREGRS